MIWDYQRSAVFNVVWSGFLEFERGQRLKFIGKLTNPTTLEAAVIVELDGTVHEQAEHDRLDTLFPLEGKVFSCDHLASKTVLAIYQTVPNLFSFPNLAHHRAFLMVPEFWNFLEEKSDWSDLMPGWRQLRVLREQRYHHADIADDAWAVYRYTKLAGIFSGDEVQEINGNIMAKVEQLFRLKRRAEYGNRLKLHLLTLSNGEGRSYILDELVHEGPMMLEHSAFAAYAVLDLTALLVNQVLKLGVSELNTSFTAVLGKGSSDQGEANLRNLHPTMPLTVFWMAEQEQWIAVLREMRHEFAHRGASAPVYGPNERMLAANPNLQTGEIPPFFDVQDTVSRWFSRAEAFFTESLRLLAKFCRDAVKPFETSPTQHPIVAPKPTSVLRDTLRETLRLFFLTKDVEPKRDEFLYARLEPSWRKKWPLPKFRAFLAAIDGFALDHRHAVGYSSDGDSATASAKLILSMRGKSLPWILRLKKMTGGRASLAKTPMTLPLNVEGHTVVGDYIATQSGPETGHSCAEFRFSLTNMGSKTLQSVSAHIAHSDIEAASAEIGSLGPGESVCVFARTTPEVGRTLPPGGPYLFVTLISDSVIVRVAYELETDLGSCWCDEHHCANPADKPLGKQVLDA